MRSISNFDDSGNIILRNRQLNFNNLVAVVTDSRVQEDTLILVYYSEATQSIAQAANINVQTNTGNITFTAANQPTGTIVCDIVLLSANIVNQVANASDIDYSNTASGLTATDVQGAVDELAQSYPAEQVMMSDGVTSVEEAVDEVAEKISASTLDNRTAITGDFVAPSDGYVNAVAAAAGDYASCRIYGSNSNLVDNVAIIGVGYQSGIGASAFYVKKGMRISHVSIVAGAKLWFIPYI